MKTQLCSIIASMILASAGVAQVETASLEGIVQDPSGAVVPGAKVRVVNASTNLENRSVTGSDGRFFLPSLPPGGPYTITVEAPGFKTEQRWGITLQVNQAARVDINLEIGAASETVKVTGEAPLVETTTAAMGQVINNRTILDLPLNQRNAYSLIFLVPGVTGTVSNQFNSGNISVNGGRPGSSEVLVDGIPSAPGIGVPIQGFSVFPSVDSVQEFKVQTNSYSAEFGRSGSGIINLIYKSGTNQYHGSLFEFLRNSDLDSNNFFSNRNGVNLPSFKRNQFGGSVGGPLDIPKLYNGRDKTFFFFAYEGLRQGTASTTTLTVPTALQRIGDSSHTFNAAGQLVTIYDPTTTVTTGSVSTRAPFQGNMIPANRIDPVAANIVKYYPLPNQPGAKNTGLNNFYSAGTAVLNSDTVDAKVDENISDRNRFFVRYSSRNLAVPLTPVFPATIRVAQTGSNVSQVSHSAAVDETFTQSPTFLLEFRYGFGRTLLTQTTLSEGFNPTTLGFPSYIAANADHLLFPGIAPQNYATLGAANQGAHGIGGYDTHSWGVGATKVVSRHVIKFGGEARLLRVGDDESGSSDGNFSFPVSLTQGPNPNAATTIAGNGFASFLLGVGTGQMIIQSKNSATQSTYYALYLQDDWKVTRNLTLNLGLRWDVEMPRTERYNRLSTFDPTAPSPLAATTGLAGLRGGVQFVGVTGASRRQFPPQWADLAPRFGFAYDINHKTAVRGGFGIFFARSLRAAGGTVGNEGFSAVTQYTGSPDNLRPSVYLSNPFPTGINRPAGSSQGLLTGLGTTFEDPLTGDNHVPYTENWDFEVQRQLPGNLLVDASYVGSHGLQLNKASEGDYNLNQLRPDTMALGAKLQLMVHNPFLGIITTGPESTAMIPMSYLVAPFPQFTGPEASFITGGYTIYHAFQLKVEKRFSSGLSFLLGFTGQKLIDNYAVIENLGNNTGGIQNIYNEAAERSVSPNDISRRLVISGIYQLPFGRARTFGANWSRALDALIGGWQVNGIATYQTGFPLSITTQNTCGCGSNTLRPNNDGHSAALSGPVSSRLNEYFNVSVFSQPAPFTFGNTGRTLPDVRAPGLQNIDLSLFKQFAPAERLTVQFRAEAFNLLNQVVFGSPNTVFSSGQAGVITAQANSPRTIQFGLKLLF
ncbi:MAG: TonB-dependent receptor [Acidobacteriaceae bacterium]|nr:TonB-dependent receptor [Acidobacteriaceae bacterium]